MKAVQRILGAAIAIVAIGLIVLQSWARSAPRPANLGVTNGQLAACPRSPNCVSSQADPSDRTHAMEPIAYTGNMETAKSRLLEVLRTQPRATLISDDGPYLALEFRTPLVGYTDDVEFLFDDAAKQIHFRSASRLGEGDMGANRTRMQQIIAAFAATS